MRAQCAFFLELVDRHGHQFLEVRKECWADFRWIAAASERAFGLVAGPFQALQPQAVSVGMLRFDVLGDPQADLEGRRLEGAQHQLTDHRIDQIAADRLAEVLLVVG